MSCDTDPTKCTTKSLCEETSRPANEEYNWNYSCVNCSSCSSYPGVRPDDTPAPTGYAGAASAKECCELCKATPQCEVGEFLSDSGACYLWNSVTKYTPLARATSIVVNSKAPVPCSMGANMKPGDPVAPPYFNNKTAAATTPTECCALCKSDATCVAGMLYANTCFLWDKVTKYTNWPGAITSTYPGSSAPPPKL